MSMKNSNDTIGNRTRDHTTCSSVPQPHGPPRAPIYYVVGCMGMTNLLFFSYPYMGFLLLSS
jgi:hypothetical protein